MDIPRFLAEWPALRLALGVVARHGPPGGWIGAGALRNAVWDALHGREPDLAGADLDVVLHDARSPDAAQDRAWAALLTAASPGLAWSVTNQSRMHARHGHAPYPAIQAAVAHWPETATAIAARMDGGRLVILAPHGLADLRAMRLRPTPAYREHPGIVEDRIARKGWAARWPKLHIRLA